MLQVINLQSAWAYQSPDCIFIIGSSAQSYASTPLTLTLQSYKNSTAYSYSIHLLHLSLLTLSIVKRAELSSGVQCKQVVEGLGLELGLRLGLGLEFRIGIGLGLEMGLRIGPGLGLTRNK